jgi:hypothetical protein
MVRRTGAVPRVRIFSTSSFSASPG